MNVELISFQKVAISKMRKLLADAMKKYQIFHDPQVVSLQAPTGAGKTIMAAALIEDIYNGHIAVDGTFYEGQPEAIFVWLSDSPELNEQSKQKLELKTSKLTFGQCKTISEESFDQEVLDDGTIYFLNTQRISKTGKLTQHRDDRQYTIWETLENTIQQKSDRLYFIIDEAHRGAKTKKAAGTDTTIMQRFLKGYKHVEDGVEHEMHPMPVVLGMSATANRFNTLIKNIDASYQHCIVTADDVRSSGLLKDRIVITYPEDTDRNNEMVLLEAATEEWLKKCSRWYQYTYEQHYANVDPVLVIQVQAGSGSVVSRTNLDDALAKVEEKCGFKFKAGEVVHCFGDSGSIEINGLSVPHVNASDIAGNHKIKVVFFKESLSTGWDCPRAETMMSFATRNDPTYIAQLLGRMVRTPLQMRVMRDEFLNDVKLYLPYFDRETVKSVVEELQASEGGDIPTEIDGVSLAETGLSVYTTRPTRHNTVDPNQISIFDQPAGYNAGDPLIPLGNIPGSTAPEYIPPQVKVTPVVNTEAVPVTAGEEPVRPADPIPDPEPQGTQMEIPLEINRDEIVQFINSKGFLTYLVRKNRINDYFESLIEAANFLTRNNIHKNARNEIVSEVVSRIRKYIDWLRANGRYDKMASQIMQFKLGVQVYDPFGAAIRDGYFDNLLMSSETDLDRQLRNADIRLGKCGIPNQYGITYFDEDDPNRFKIDCILFAANDDCISDLGNYAKHKLNELSNTYRHKVAATGDERIKREFKRIYADSSEVSRHLFNIPTVTDAFKDHPEGEEYNDHLLVNEQTGVAKLKLNNWEAELIREERLRPDFVCWLRNPNRGSWGLCVTHEIGGETKGFHPDFLVIRRDPDLGYIVDILEPHGDHLEDNLSKAKGLARYAENEMLIGRIQLIRKMSDDGGIARFSRLELTDMIVRDRVLRCNTNDDLKNVFRDLGV